MHFVTQSHDGKGQMVLISSYSIAAAGAKMNSLLSTALEVVQLWLSGADTGFMKRGALYIKRCRRQCIEAPQEFSFRLNFSLLTMGSRGTFALLHCKFQMYEDCRSQGRHELLPWSNFAHERNTHVHGGVY